jgi:Ion channel
MDEVAISLPLLVGIVANAATIVIHALAVRATVAFVRHEDQAGRVGIGFWTGVAVLAVVVFFALVAHLLEIGVWAVLFMLCGEFPAFATALDHSAVNYTTLGYGNVIMTPSWRFLGPLEAANGMLLFGVSAALVFSVIQYLIRAGRSAGNVWRP